MQELSLPKGVTPSIFPFSGFPDVLQQTLKRIQGMAGRETKWVGSSVKAVGTYEVHRCAYHLVELDGDSL